jgi:ribosome maturation factor RimP
MNEKQLQTICEAIARHNGFMFIDARLRGSRHLPVVEVYIDGKEHLHIDDCAKVSRDINTALESSGELGANFRLDVSSPGTDRPLKFLDQFHKHISRTFDVVYASETGTVTLKGVLLRVEGESLFFRTKDNSETTVPFSGIVSAKVIVNF